MRQPEHVALSDALVTNFFTKPEERFVPLVHQTRLLAALAGTPGGAKPRGRIGLDFGSVGLCHVAAGFTDAMIEFAKGFAIWDLLPGHYILTAAGGTVVDLEGKRLTFDHTFETMDAIGRSMNQRQRFIAARTSDLAVELAAAKQ
jgi:myo-inositol-1(or 4)-monophosphatase